MTSVRWVVLSAFLGLVNFAAFGETKIPPEIDSEATDFMKDCKDSAFEKNPILSSHIDVAGVRYYYYIIDFESATCDGQHDFCGMTGNCSKLIFIKTSSAGKFKKVFDDSVIDVSIGSTKGQLTLTVQPHCPPGDDCTQILYWNGETFVESRQ